MFACTNVEHLLIGGHAGGRVALEEGIGKELEEEDVPFKRLQELPVAGLLPPDKPRLQSVGHKLDALMLDVGEGRSVEVGQHVGRNVQQPGDLPELELPAFKELCVLRRDTRRRPTHALFENGDPVLVR
jgi:hypothetical protein